MNGLLCRALLTGGVLSTCVALAEPTNSNWAVHVWQSDDGLPNNNVTGITQGPDGYLWIASLGRLARFDGVQFEDFAPRGIHPDLPQRPATLTFAHDGTLWLGMDQGIAVRMDGASSELFTNGLPVQLATTITEDSDGSIWITYRGNFVCRIRNGRVTRFSSEHFGTGYGLSLAADSVGNLWFARGGRVGLFRNERFETLLRLGNEVTRITPASTGGIWICAGTRLYRRRDGGQTEDLGGFQPNTPGAEPTTIVEDNAGGVWIGTTSSGLFHYRDSCFEHVPIAHREILSLFSDREGNLWAGTGGGGLNRISRRAVSLEGAETGLPFEALQSLAEDPQGTIWATTQTGALVRRTEGKWSVVHDLPNNRFRGSAVASDASGAMWVGTFNHQLHCWRDGRFTTWSRTNGLAGRTIHALLPSRSGDLWIGEESPDLVQRLRNGKFDTFHMPQQIRIIRAMAEDTAGNIWIGSSKGMLLRIKDDQVSDETVRLMGGLMSIRCMLATPDGAVWVGFAGFGVGRIKDGRFNRISVEQGLNDVNISQMVADDRGWIWFGADRGIFRVRQQELDDVADGKAERVGCIQHGRDEGLSSLQANFGDSPGAMRSRDGRLWIPMRSALAVVNPKQVREDANPPKIRLEQLKVDDKPVARHSWPVPVRDALNLQDSVKVRLSPRHHRLEFEFTALSFRAPENVRFRYRLDGFDEDWIEAGKQRSAAYSRLSAGDYRFLVTACNSDGLWSPTNASLAFVVTPFFWQTWWFRLGVLAAIVGTVRYVSFRRLRTKLQLLEQQAALDKERARIAKDLHDDLGTRLTKIVLLSGLARRDRSVPEKADEHIAKIAVATRQVIKSLDETVWAVNPRNDTLPDVINYISQFAVEFLHTAEIRCRTDLPEHPSNRVVSAKARHNLFLAVKEALNNIVRHSSASAVQLRITVNDELLRIVIEDDGRGFGQEPADLSADGLRNMRQRMEEISGGCDIESQPGAGTRISLVCPWRNGH